MKLSEGVIQVILVCYKQPKWCSLSCYAANFIEMYRTMLKKFIHKIQSMFKSFFYLLFRLITFPFFKIVRAKQNKLKTGTDRRYQGLWMAPPPSIVSLEDLRDGDVLFCGGALKDKVTDLIQNSSDGPYTHCGVYLGSGKVVDVVTSGIRNIELNEFVSNYEYVTVTRCRGLDTSEEKLNTQRIDKLKEFALSCINNNVKYDWKSAVLSPLKEFKNIKFHYKVGVTDNRESSHHEQSNYFCSQFVLACIKATGWIDEESSYFEPICWTPTGLAEENIFHFIGFMSDKGLKGVSKFDPFLAGNSWVLSEEGQKELKQRQLEFKKRIKLDRHLN